MTQGSPEVGGTIAPVYNRIEVGDEDVVSLPENGWQHFMDNCAARNGLELDHDGVGFQALLEQDITGILGDCGEDCVAGAVIPGAQTGVAAKSPIELICRFAQWEGAQDGHNLRERCLTHHLQGTRGIIEVIERQDTSAI